jgi:hypothetical protein
MKIIKFKNKCFLFNILQEITVNITLAEKLCCTCASYNATITSLNALRAPHILYNIMATQVCQVASLFELQRIKKEGGEGVGCCRERS